MPQTLKTALLLSSLFLLTACASPTVIEASKVAAYCDYAERIWFTYAKELEGLETETLRQIKKHNDRMKEICGK